MCNTFNEATLEQTRAALIVLLICLFCFSFLLPYKGVMYCIFGRHSSSEYAINLKY